MLIKLTSKCTMMYPHCMEDAQPEGLMMTLDTFKQAVKFGTYIGNGHFVLSGGEPTENAHITEMCEWLDILRAGEEKTLLEVRFVRGVFAFLWNGDLDDEFPCNAPTQEWAEVVGNIHDNPKMIKRK